MPAYRVPDPLDLPHVLAFIYLAFAHQSNGDLSVAEKDVIAAKVGGWMGGSSGKRRIRRKVEESVKWLESIPDEFRIDEMVNGIVAIRGHFPEDGNRKAVYEDVVAIAEADGDLSEIEKHWLGLLKQNLGL